MDHKTFQGSLINHKSLSLPLSTQLYGSGMFDRCCVKGRNRGFDERGGFNPFCYPGGTLEIIGKWINKKINHLEWVGMRAAMSNSSLWDYQTICVNFIKSYKFPFPDKVRERCQWAHHLRVGHRAKAGDKDVRLDLRDVLCRESKGDMVKNAVTLTLGQHRERQPCMYNFCFFILEVLMQFLLPSLS